MYSITLNGKPYEFKTMEISSNPIEPEPLFRKEIALGILYGPVAAAIAINHLHITNPAEQKFLYASSPFVAYGCLRLMDEAGKFMSRKLPAHANDAEEEQEYL